MRRILLILTFLYLTLAVSAQDSLSTVDRVLSFPSKFLSGLNKKATQLEEKVIAKSEKALKRLSNQEEKLKRKLARKDSLAAVNVFGDVTAKYASLKQGLQSKTNKLEPLKEYLPRFDTLKTSLNFLSQQPGEWFAKAGQLKQVQQTLGNIESLESKLQQAEQIKQYIRERRQQLKDQLGKFGMAKQLKQFNKEVYYYSEQLKEYKAILQDPKKMEQKAISMLTKLPVFQQFMKENSMLASLFRLPEGYGSMASLQGLQTRAGVQNLIQQRIATGGPNAQAVVQQGLQQAQAQLTQLKNKLNQLGGGSSSDVEMPDFKPNGQKTKSFFKRLEYGTNVQSTKSNLFLPTTSDIGLSVGYKLNDKSIIGIGASYKMGWGKDIRHISISHEGVGLRSFIDWKIKGRFFITGGYEQNYRVRFDNVQQLRTNPDHWQQSALLGLSKKYSVGKKFKGNMQILYDFLHVQQVPRTQPVVFRVGYNLK